MTEKDSTPALDPELARNVATIKRGIEAKVGEIKRDLAQWLNQSRHPSENVEVSLALLETAIDRYLATHENAADVLDLIQAVFRRAVRKRNGSLQ